MRRAAGVAVSCAVLVLSGCGSLGGTTPQRGPVEPVAAGCPLPESQAPGTWYSSVELLPDDLVTKGVVQCVGREVSDAKGRWSAVVQQTVTGDAAEPLLAALRLGDDRSTPTGACAAMLSLWPWLAVVLPDGRWQPVGVPVTGCGQPKQQAYDAFDAAVWTETPPVKVALQQTADEVSQEAKAADAGCAYMWKDEIGMVGDGDGRVPKPGLPPSGDVTVCRYEIPSDSLDGIWVGGGPVGVAEADEVRAALSATEAAPPCTARRSGFVVVAGNNGDFVTVDLSCPRLMVGDALGALPQGSTDLLVSLTPDA